MNAKPTILVFIDWFWPGYLAGGPVQSLVSLVQYLGSDIHFKIVTTNRDLGSKAAYPIIEPGKWLQSPLGCEVFYIDPHTLNAALIKRIIDETTFDTVYINSFFSKFFSIVPLQILNRHYKNKPVILAPRGMLGPGALAIKPLKKKAFILFSKLSGLHSRVTWHATSAQEEKEIRTVFGNCKAVTVSNLPKKLGAPADKLKPSGSLNLCFISRISEKKNLVYALSILSGIRDADIRYNIYGPVEDAAYWDKCQKLIAALPANISVNYKGSLSPAELEGALATEHMMLMPTLNENFGHSIVESLLCGCPVIISDQTPWTDLEPHNAGYAFSLASEQLFISAVQRCATLGQAEFSEKSSAAIRYIRAKINLPHIIQQYIHLFNERIKN